MSNKLVIRPARPADLDALWALCLTVKRQLTADNIPIWDEAYPSREIFAEDIAANGLLVAEEGGVLLGSLNGSADFSTEYFFDLPEANRAAAVRALLAICGADPARSTSVHRLMVAPHARRRGIAEKLLHAFEQQNAGLWVVFFAAGCNQPACQLYHKLGYVDYGPYSFSFGEMRYLAKPLLSR